MILNSSSAQSESLLASSYRKLYEAFKGENCDSSISSNTTSNSVCANKNTTQKNLSDLNNFSEDQFFTQLALLESDRLQCGLSYWQSLSEGANQKAFLDLIKKKLPLLNLVKKAINDLNVRNALLKGKIPNNSYPHQQNISDPYKDLQTEYKLNNTQLQKLIEIYESIMATIPHSDIPAFRDFIENKAGTSGLGLNKVQAVTESDLDKIIGVVTLGFQTSLQDLNSKKTKDSQHQLSDSQKETLATDSFLISQLMQKQPSCINFIEKYKCQVLHTKKGKEGLWDGVSYLGMALSAGAPAILGLSRIAWLSRGISTLSETSSLSELSITSRIASYSSLLVGAGHSLKDISDQCLSSSKSTVKGSCHQTPQTILHQNEFGNCILTASLFAMGNASGPLEKILKTNSTSLSKVVNEVRIGSEVKNIRATRSIEELASGSNLLRLKADQVAQSNPAEALKLYTQALNTEKITNTNNIRYLSIKVGALAEKDSEAALKAKQMLNDALNAEIKNSIKPNDTSAQNFRNKFIQDRINQLSSDNQVDTTKWEIKTLREILNGR